ncbi:hypothetical protein J6590_087089 [Homalodisca vitripennis]|nr:hypothetical protein J6590_087089 [Homalodisca vitripennis]
MERRCQLYSLEQKVPLTTLLPPAYSTEQLIQPSLRCGRITLAPSILHQPFIDLPA